ncbi:MAG TPA: glycoside hydrolase family 130 protein [Saprospiraceae bacterium]|nr:glycoside hydrolase family 130 protein [Saprospiraceae bacterium]
MNSIKRVLYGSVLLINMFWFGCKEVENQSFYLNTWKITTIEKFDSINPILSPDTTMFFIDPISNKGLHWESRNVLNPSAIVKNDTVFLFYRAQDAKGTSRIGLAYSEDGLHFSRYPNPVFYPDNDSMFEYEWNYLKKKGDTLDNCKSCYFDGVEDPRIVQREDGLFVMTYTAYDGKTARLSLASSMDLFTWEKQGLILADKKYKDTWSKSGAIVSKLIDNKVVATKIDNKYWMYFGDTKLFIAYSDDLINWIPLENEESQKLIEVLWPRPGYFDSRLVEPGPFALMTKEGIALIYNSSNAANANDVILPKYTYVAGQALYDAQIPYKLLDRTHTYFIRPDQTYEQLGEVNDVCFVEGMVFFKKQWLLYYGTADSKIAVAKVIN